MIAELYIKVFKNWSNESVDALFTAVPILCLPLVIEYFVRRRAE